MENFFRKHQKNIKENISKINRYSKKNSNYYLYSQLIISILIAILILKITRQYMLKLPNIVFYILSISILIVSFAIPIIRVKILSKKYTKKIDKHIQNVYDSLNELYDVYREKLIEKINSIESKVILKFVANSKSIDDSNLIQYKLEEGIFEEKIIHKEIYLDNEEKVKYLEDTISKIEEFMSTKMYKDFKQISSVSFIAKYLPDGEFKRTVLNLNELFNIVNAHYTQRKEQLTSIKKPLQLGIDGENIVNEHLKIYEDEIINLSNIRIELNGNSIENDNILITKKGIFILEVKNIGSTGSYSILVQNDGRWIKKYNNNTSEVIEFNATEQNDRHIAIFKKFINNKLNRSIEKNNYLKVDGIVVIANNTLDIKNESMQNIYRISEIYRYIDQFEDVLTYKEMLEIKELITKENLKPRKYAIPDYKYEIENNIKIISKLIDKVGDELKKLSEIYKYLNNSGYLNCYYWVFKSNILNQFTNSKFNNINSINYVSDEVIRRKGLELKIDNIEIENIEIKKIKSEAIGIVLIMAAVTIFMVINMNLLYIPGERLKPEVNKDTGKVGYVDENGKVIIGYKYDASYGFTKYGFAHVMKNNKFGLIDKTGKLIIDYKYDNTNKILGVSENCIAVYEDGKWNLLNKTGKKITNKQYDSISCASNNIISVNVDGKKGRLDSKGNEIIEPIYDEIEDVKNGLFIVSKNEKYGLMDNEGKEFLPIEYQNISNKVDYLRLKKDNKFGILDLKSKKIVADLKYQKMYAYNRDILIVQLNGKYGLISEETYEEILEPIYDEIGEYDHTSQAKIKLNGKWGLLNDKAELIVPIKYDEIYYIWVHGPGRHYGDVFKVKLDDKWGLLNDNYDLVIPIEYDDIIYTYGPGLDLLKNEEVIEIDIDNLEHN